MVSWKLVALLKTEKYGTFEQFVKSDHRYIHVDFSWVYFWRQLRDTKAVDGVYLAIAAAVGFILKWVWDKLVRKAPKPTARPAPDQESSN